LFIADCTLWLGALVPLWFFVNLALIGLASRVMHALRSRPSARVAPAAGAPALAAAEDGRFNWKPYSRTTLALCLTAYMP
jgi:hypothetical protein